jgi:outer membrane cobalamin receptor
LARLTTIVPALLGTLVCGDVLAEQERLDEILVTATRRTVSLAEVSSGLTLVEGAAARAQKLVTDALEAEVGVDLQQTTPGQGAAIIRGLKGSSILHLVDGMRLNNAIFRSAPTQYFALVPTGAVERIEVLRGTPASLYGSDAVGGVEHGGYPALGVKGVGLLQLALGHQGDSQLWMQA